MFAFAVLLCLGAAEENAEPAGPPEPGPASDYETVVRDRQRGGIESQRRLDAKHPGFATAIDLEHEAGARSAAALPEVLARSPGATVRSIGGLGQFSSISLRGSSAKQVAVFIEGVPVSDSMAGLVSLSDFPLETLGRVEVFRGYVPVFFGSAAMGGAVNLVGRVYRGPTRATATTGWGSFGAFELGGGVGQPIGQDHSLTAHLGYASARGDFPFYDVNHTPDNPSDDQIGIRQNNGYRRLLGHLRLDGQSGEWRYGAQQLTLVKNQQIPSPSRAQAEGRAGETHLSTLSLRLLGSAKRPALAPGGRFAVVLGAGFDRVHFVDPVGEVGTGQDDEITLGTDLYVSPYLRVPLWTGAFLTTSLDLRFEHQSIDNRLEGEFVSGDAERVRGSYGVGLQLEQFLFANRLHLVPVVRLDITDSRFAVPDRAGEINDGGRDQTRWAVSPRAAVRFSVFEGLQLRTSAGRYFRPPNMAELFGDRGYLVGNEGLVAEQGSSLDGGMILDLASAPLALYVQAAGFAVWSEQLITWEPIGNYVRALNLEGAIAAGFEGSMIVNLFGERIGLHANYTFLDSVNKSPEQEQNGKPLPGRARHELFARLSVAETYDHDLVRTEGRLFYSFDLLSGTYLDLSGRFGLPPRLFHGAGLEITLWPRVLHRLSVRVAFEVRNLTDAIAAVWTPGIPGASPQRLPIVDFIDYPLPGRSFWLSLVVSGPSADEKEL